jgi:hypothetical protein
MDYGYTLVGFIGNTANPFFLPNHDIIPRPLMQYIIDCCSYGGVIYINLPLLYKLKWVHGKIDLYDIGQLGGTIILLDEKYENPFKNLPLTNIPLENKSKMYNWLNDGDTLDPTTLTTLIGRSRKDRIIEIEQKYPGLFKPIFINPSPPPIKEIIAPQIIVSNKSKKKQSKPPRDVALTKKYRNQRSKQTFPDWWEVKSE